MALSATIPPWLDIGPQTYTGAMAGGARLGLEARGQDISQAQAADRLQLAYQQLSAKEEMAAQALEGKMALAQSQLEMKDKAMQLGAALRERGLDQSLFNIQSLDQKRQFDEELAGQKAEAAKQYLHWGKDSSLSRFNPETGKVEVIQPPGAAALPEPTLKIEIPQSGLFPQSGLANITGKLSQLPLIQSMIPKRKMVSIAQKLHFAEPTLIPSTNAPTAPAPTMAPSQLPTSSPAIITDKKGKKWKYTGTMPDPTKDRDESHWEELK